MTTMHIRYTIFHTYSLSSRSKYTLHFCWFSLFFFELYGPHFFVNRFSLYLYWAVVVDFFHWAPVILELSVLSTFFTNVKFTFSHLFFFAFVPPLILLWMMVFVWRCTVVVRNYSSNCGKRIIWVQLTFNRGSVLQRELEGKKLSTGESDPQFRISFFHSLKYGVWCQYLV